MLRGAASDVRFLGYRTDREEGGNYQRPEGAQERHILPNLLGPYPRSGFIGAGDRPIGLLQNANGWVLRGLFLTFPTAQHAATTSPSGYGTGVVELRYGYLEKEDYSIYLKIERLP